MGRLVLRKRSSARRGFDRLVVLSSMSSELGIQSSSPGRVHAGFKDEGTGEMAEIEASVLAGASLAAAKGLEDSSGVTTPILSSDEETSVRPELFDADTEASDGDDTPERPEPSSEVMGGG